MIVDTISAIEADSRTEFWIEVINRSKPETFLEVGVWKGEFAEAVLKRCPSIKTYYMLDPWRHLERWNKPFNLDSSALDEAYEEAMARTDFAKEQRVVLRGTTSEKIGEIPDSSLDFAYIDGDHTLRGITIDLVACYPKIRAAGILAGDDFSKSIWQHQPSFEPTLVAPFAVYFAEAVNNPIAACPFQQFAIEKVPGFSFSGGGDYSLELLPQIARPKRTLGDKIRKRLKALGIG
jgi:hypothetical protein